MGRVEPTTDPPRPTSPRLLEAALRESLDLEVEVVLGRSRTRPVQAQRRGSSWTIRLHRAFLDADEEVIAALGLWLRAGRRARRAGALLDAWIEQHVLTTPEAPRRTRRGSPQGDCYDLAALAADLWDGFMAGALPAEQRPWLEWGPRRASRSRGGLRLGSWDPATNRVRIHPVLDSPTVPTWFVRTVLVHELLHAALPPLRDAAGRWRPHHPEFRRREAEWPDHQRARAWERTNLGALVRRARALGSSDARP